MTRGPGRAPGRDAVTVLVLTVLRRPDLWWSALGALRRLAAPGWWRDRPYLPLPDPELWRFRMTTAYGRADVDPEPADVISYLAWCRATAAHRHPAAEWTRAARKVGPLDAGRSG